MQSEGEVEVMSLERPVGPNGDLFLAAWRPCIVQSFWLPLSWSLQSIKSSWKFYPVMDVPCWIPAPLKFNVESHHQILTHFLIHMETSSCCLCSCEESKGRTWVPHLLGTGDMILYARVANSVNSTPMCVFFHMQDMGYLLFILNWHHTEIQRRNL